jgi:Uma2 family endonuclease
VNRSLRARTQTGADYQTLSSLKEYVLINTKRPGVECFRRNDEGLWVLQSYIAENKSFRLHSVNFEGTIAELYEYVVYTSSNSQQMNS